MSMKLLFKVTVIICTLCIGESKEGKRARNGGTNFLLKFKDHFEQQIKTSDDVSLPFTRETNLYSRAAKKYLQIVGRRISADGRRRSIHSRFLVESDNFGRVRFKGIKSGRYLCMTKTGQLIAKADRRTVSWKKGKKNRRDRQKRKSMRQKFMRRCVFKEVFGRNAYTAYKLAANESWYLAIDKNGRPKRGTKTRPGLKAVHFIERPIGVKRDDVISERSRSRIFRRRSKKKHVKQTTSFQKSLRSLPLQKDSYIVDFSVIGAYIKKFQNHKKQLKQAIKGLIKLKRKVDSEQALDRTSQTIKYSSAFKRIISKLKANGVAGN